jgi:penicillin-binding protein 2
VSPQVGPRLSADAQGVLEGRLVWLAALMALAFGVFWLRLFQLQILEGEALSQKSLRNAVRHVPLAAPRGRIVDRSGRVLATTRPAFGLEVMPSDLDQPGRELAALAELVAEDPARLRERFGEPRGRARFQPLELLDDLSFDQLARVESHLYALPGVSTSVQPRRHYLEGPLAAHLLGSIGEITARQLESERFGDYRPGDVVGQSGLEAEHERHLRGRPGGRNVVVDVAGRAIGEPLEEVLPLPGGTLVLTLDLELQRAAEDALDQLTQPGVPRIGAVTALDPRSGEVLVLASRPSYDPNVFAGGIDAGLWRQLSEDEWRPLHARAIQSHYPPGSTYKALVAAAGLQEGLVRPEARVFCPGSFRLGRRSYRCWKETGHGSVDLYDALVQSCDVYFYQLGLQLGIDRLARYAQGFGLGRPSGVGLRGEVPGLVPTAAWKEQRFHEPWMLGETVSASIGQGFNLVSPLQLALAYAAIANGGPVPRPRVVQRLEDRDGRTLREFAPETLTEAPVAPGHLARVRRALAGVVQGAHGTGARARVPGVEVAGKTGTAQVVRLEHTEGLDEDEVPVRSRDHAWFVAFAPAEGAEIVVSVVIEHGGHGGSAAAPVAQRVLARYFELRAAEGAAPAAPPAPIREARLRPGGADAGR